MEEWGTSFPLNEEEEEVSVSEKERDKSGLNPAAQGII